MIGASVVHNILNKVPISYSQSFPWIASIRMPQRGNVGVTYMQLRRLAEIQERERERKKKLLLK